MKEKDLPRNKKVFITISLIQIIITIIPVVIIYLSIKNGEWGRWGDFTIVLLIFNQLVYSPDGMLFAIFLLFTLFNPVYKRSAMFVLIRWY